MNLRDIEITSTEPRSEAPASVQGTFNLSVEVYTVARKGDMTLVGVAEDCTYEGDAPSRKVQVPQAPRVLIVTHHRGNGGWSAYRLYA